MPMECFNDIKSVLIILFKLTVEVSAMKKQRKFFILHDMYMI